MMANRCGASGLKNNLWQHQQRKLDMSLPPTLLKSRLDWDYPKELASEATGQKELLNDNQGVIALAHNSEFHVRTK